MLTVGPSVAAESLRQPALARARLEVRGIVQGVGFRPFVYRLANELRLDGWVRNDAVGVIIDIQGAGDRIDVFARRVRDEAPPRARVDSIARDGFEPVHARSGFAILDSASGSAVTTIGPDSAVCDDCLAELFDPVDARYRYAFINCTNCGPRYTITRSLPYDRTATSMAPFEQCATCLVEYRSPSHRRFHAEANACPTCGPRLALFDSTGGAIDDVDPIAATVAALQHGAIVAIKGLGGFHLACNARNACAVQTLRRRKTREQKPFAVMAANVASLFALGALGPAERALLTSPERPIVLVRKRANTDATLPDVAPGLAWLGAMLPYTPLQYLLFHEALGRPSGCGWLAEPHDLVLVMTSANPGGEPLVTSNDEAFRRLRGIVDGFLTHDRAIVRRCDDSVVRLGPVGAPQFIRRARGYTPRAIKLAAAGPPVIALGGHFKNTLCVTRGDEAFVSEHIGELDNAPTCRSLVEAAAHLTALIDVQPVIVAHDLHPDFFSSRHASTLAAQWHVTTYGVQHHHAHIAAIAAEHRESGPLLGLALDGVGLGNDGSAWGGELLLVDGVVCKRLARLRPLPLPGGDRAAREPWRVAAAALALGGRGSEIATRFGSESAAATVAAMLERRFNAPLTSSMGRWFDAAAGMLGICGRTTFEGQAPMLLEGLADAYGRVEGDPRLFAMTETLELDLTPLLLQLADERDPRHGAALFHATVVMALDDWVARAAKQCDVSTVACGGGCFLNAIVANGLRRALDARGIAMLEASAVPPSDGGLSLGQAWVALQVVNGA